MTAAGKIKLHRDSKSPDWVFDTVNGLPASWTQTAQGNGSQMNVEDTLVPAQENFTYTVTVSYNGNTYTSPLQTASADAGVPPIIQNDGSMPGTHPKPKPTR
jgi:hypothetical protein